MEFSGDDIDVFVLTYNRANLLPITLQSLLAQTEKGIRVTILDNGSNDDTAEVVKPFIEIGMRYLTTEINVGWAGNLSRAQALSERPWVMLFHDDDLLHPDYLKVAINTINATKNIVLLGSGMSFEKNPTLFDWPSTNNPKIKICPTANSFADALYGGFHFHFGSAVYKTSVFQKTKWDGLQYGKIADRPFLIDVAKAGTTVIFEDPFIRYRLHTGQDSNATNTGPFAIQLAALHRCYRDILRENIFSPQGLTFLKKNYEYLYSEFQRLPQPDRAQLKRPIDYLKFVKNQRGASLKSLIIGILIYSAKGAQEWGRAILSPSRWR